MIKLYPDIYEKNIYNIDYHQLKDNGIKCILFDLDNTCAPISIKEPNERLINLFNQLKELDFKLVIFSNSSKKRILPFKNILNIDCSARSFKPSIRKLSKILNRFAYDLSEVAIIGDHLLVDIYCGNRMGITTILVNPLSKKDKASSKSIRIIEKLILKRMMKKGYLTYGKYYK